MPFGVDPQQIKQVVADIATIKGQQDRILEQCALILNQIRGLQDHGNQTEVATLPQPTLT